MTVRSPELRQTQPSEPDLQILMVTDTPKLTDTRSLGSPGSRATVRHRCAMGAHDPETGAPVLCDTQSSAANPPAMNSIALLCVPYAWCASHM